MAEPLAITTAIITLSRTLRSVVRVLDDFANAHQTVLDIKRDCDLTTGVLECIREHIAVTPLPALATDPDEPPDVRIDLNNLLDDNVHQLQVEVTALADQLKALKSPGSPDTKLGRLVMRGQVTWKLSYLNTMHQKIVTKRMQLEVVLNTLNHLNSSRRPPANRRGSDDSAIFVSFIEKILSWHDRVEPNPLPTPSPAVQGRIMEAIKAGERRKLESLLQHVDPNFHVRVDGKQLSPLHIAAMRGELAMVNVLITRNARVDCCGGGEDTPLTLAISNSHAIVALALLRRGANLVLANAQEQTPLQLAAKQNLYAVAQALINNAADVDAYDQDGRTPLMEAVCRYDRDIQPNDTCVLRRLLQPRDGRRGADPTIGILKRRAPPFDKPNYTPLHHAAAMGYLQDLELMLDALASRSPTGIPLVLDEDGRTPLWYASRHGHLDAITLLLSKTNPPTHINHPSLDPDASTPLWALATLHPTALPAISDLITAGADPNFPHPTTGQTLLHHAASTNNPRLLRLLLLHSPSPHLPSLTGYLPLHTAASLGHLKALRTLLPHSPPNPPADDGTTPLHLAAEHGHIHLLPELLSHCREHPTNPHVRDDAGCDPFYLACARGHLLAAAYLLGSGAEIDGVTKRGNTALHVAARMGEVEVF
ncbi:ankyrin repeat-containing domain protein [Staphylotrichum tortipilum]|uniref:Ankyrin repeat-containing domain protein n=1 Tax=Staphylotrichum tortipilum TaxID=2831512 RepID=A0AAN6RS96_9PEZI|nr:ankyrin repeat-containing domain protein [Staphylotrichum longicolle]